MDLIDKIRQAIDELADLPPTPIRIEMNEATARRIKGWVKSHEKLKQPLPWTPPATMFAVPLVINEELEDGQIEPIYAADTEYDGECDYCHETKLVARTDYGELCERCLRGAEIEEGRR